MKVALVIYTFGGRGGAERMCAALAKGLRMRGHEIEVLAHDFTATDAVEVSRHVPISTSDTLPGQRHLTFAENVEKALATRSYDVVHSFARTTRQDILRLGGGCHVEYLRHTDEDRSWASRLFRRFNPKERAILALERRSMAPGAYRKVAAVSRRVADEAIRHYAVPERDVVVIHNGVDVNRFSPRVKSRGMGTRQALGIGDGDVMFLFVGMGFKRKGLAHAIEALARLPASPTSRLVVLGGGEVATHRRLARKLRLQERVFILGARDNPEDYYGAADAFVFPSLYDPFPNACLEALACGLPVVTTRVTGVAEIMTAGREGYLVESGTDVGAIADAMRALLDPKIRADMGAAARATAERHSIDRFIDENVKLYDQVVAAADPRPTQA